MCCAELAAGERRIGWWCGGGQGLARGGAVAPAAVAASADCGSGTARWQAERPVVHAGAVLERPFTFERCPAWVTALVR